MASHLKSSGYLFRKFLKERGIFGNRKPPDDIDSSATELPAANSIGSYLLRYLQEIRNKKGAIFAVIALGIVGTLAHATIPLMGKYMIDDVLPHKDFSLLVAGCAVLFIAAVGHVVSGFFQDYLTRRLVGTITNGIRRKMMEHLQKLPLVRLQELKVGGIISRLQADTEGMAGLLQHGVLTPFKAVMMLAVGLGALFYLNFQVALVYLLFCSLMAGCAYFVFMIMRPLQKLIREEMAQVNSRLTEVFSGIQVVRAFTRQKSEVLIYTFQIHYLWRKELHAGLLNIAVHRSMWTIYWLLLVSVWLFGGYQVIQGEMSLGVLVAFLAFAEFIFNPVFMILFSVSELQSGLACTERIFDLLDEPECPSHEPGKERLSGIHSDIVFDNVSFCYAGGQQALYDVSFTLPKGKMTALVGPSGAGKSTVTYLLMRFYETTEGGIFLHGKDIRAFDVTSYRKRLGLVLQDNILFDGTLHENIAYGKPDASQAEIEEAARISNSDEFIERFPDRYQSVIGEKGVKLSGGQKQRIALARTVLAHPEILILDEATSNLDSESEQAIRSALYKIIQGRTVLVIAHRLSTIMDADKIIVLEKGRVVEEGKHTHLLQQKGRYWQMYNAQMEKAERLKDILDWN